MNPIAPAVGAVLGGPAGIAVAAASAAWMAYKAFRPKAANADTSVSEELDDIEKQNLSTEERLHRVREHIEKKIATLQERSRELEEQARLAAGAAESQRSALDVLQRQHAEVMSKLEVQSSNSEAVKAQLATMTIKLAAADESAEKLGRARIRWSIASFCLGFIPFAAKMFGWL